MWRTLFYFFLFLLISAFLNFIVLLFLNFDLFKVDIVKNRTRNSAKMKKLTLILKNNYLFFISVCFIQNLIDYFRSRSLEEIIAKSAVGKWKVFTILLSSFVIVTVTEIFPNYAASREGSKTLILNDFLLNIASLVTLIFSPLKFIPPLKSILKERKKFFTYNEEDFTRFINNLTSKEILLLEPSEAKLVKLAFNIDNKDITSIMIPMKEAVCLNYAMQTEEVIELCLKSKLTKYPVLGRSQGVAGVFSTKSLTFSLLRGRKIVNWRSYISRKVIFLDHTTKLSMALENLKGSRNHLAFARNGRTITGIVTLKDILSSLVGKIHDETI